MIKKYLNRVFIDGLSGMALGLFCTLIIGTIITQIGALIGGSFGAMVCVVGKVASALTGAGIGCGVAYKFKETPLVVLSAAVSGMIGAFASKILVGGIISSTDAVVLAGPGEPLGAFIAAYAGIEIGHFIAGKTKVDIVAVPLVCIGVGAGVGLFLGPPISKFMTGLGDIINWGTEQQPILMGIIVSVLMGMILTLPISSAALGLVLGLDGIAAGAAAIGCCANMIGFAVISYRENKMSGLLAQGLGTSMLQVPNILKKPVIWLPAIISSAVLGPISTALLHMTNSPKGSGMGTAGLVGPIMAYQSMVGELGVFLTLVEIILMMFILPAIISLIISEGMRKLGIIKSGDLKLDI